MPSASPQALRERFAQFDLELHPEKTRVISFGRYERQNAQRQQRRPNTFDFLGFTHYCGQSRKGKFIVGRQTSRKKFRKKCQELKTWLKAVRNQLPVKEWWPVLKAKLQGHYQYYGVSGNMRGIDPLLPPRAPTGAEMAQPPQPAAVVLLGRFPGLPEALPAARAADCSQPVHPVAREVSFT